IGDTLSAAFLGLLQIARDRDLPAFRAAAGGGMCAIFVVTATALNFQLPLIARILGTSYGDLYSGYKTTFGTELGEMGSRLSYVNWLLIIAGLYISIAHRN
ncbi:hypothetical protein EN849_33195, partial [Mesorhizobium sp. M2D.F.Ca.ET.206.01.1.1]